MSKKDQKTAPPQRSALMRLLSSTKISPFLGLLAVASIFYYKGKYLNPPPKKNTHPVSRVDQRAPVLAPVQILGRTRNGGPMLTRSFFGDGDLVLRKQNAHIAVGIVLKQGKEFEVLTSTGTQKLLAWLKLGDGRFALVRLGAGNATIWKQHRESALQTLRNASKSSTQGAAASDAFALALRKQLQTHKIALPSALHESQEPPSAWLQKLAQQSHYNDFK